MTDDELIYEALREARDSIGKTLYGNPIPDTRALDHARVMCQGALDVLGRRANEGTKSGTNELEAERRYSAELVKRLAYARKLADEAWSYLDADMDMKCLKLLGAMAGRMPKYRADVDDTFDLLRPAPESQPHKPGPIADPRGIVSTTNITLPPSEDSN